MKKLFLTLLVLLGGFGAWAYASLIMTDPAETQPRYRVESANRGAIAATVSATGTVTATTTVIVGSQLSGQVVEINVDHNSEVKAGQILARLNKDTILARRDAARADLLQAQAARRLNDAQAEKVRAELARAQAQFRDMQAQLQRSGALLSDAETTLTRQSSLRARGFASDVAVQSATTARETQAALRLSAEAQIGSAAAQVSALEADIKVVEAQKASSEAQIAKAEAQVRQIEVDLSNTDIRSPVDGVVVQRNIELGQTVAASLQAPTLFLVAQDLRHIEVYVNLDETDVGRVKPGQPVEFSVSAYPGRTFGGAVRLVRLGAQTVQNVVIYTTIVQVANEDMALLPGMTANLRIFTERKSDVLRVPNAALRWQPVDAPRVALEAAQESKPDSNASAIATADNADDPAGPFANRRQGNGPGVNPGRATAILLEALKSEIGVTQEQLIAIEKMAVAMREKILLAGSDAETRREVARVERQKLNRAIDAMLDPEKQAKFREMRARQNTNRQFANANANSSQRGVPGRVYLLDERGNPKVLSLRLGASDGAFTEVVAGDIQVGDSLITGASAANKPNRASSAFRFGL